MSSKDPAAVRAASKKFYDKNPEYYRERNKRASIRKKTWIRRQREVPCLDCGVEHPWYVMEFDHARGEKGYNIAQMSNQSWKRIFAEIEKCDVVCANCHAVRTHFRRENESVG